MPENRAVLREIFQIGEILVTTDRPIVELQTFERDELKRYTVDVRGDPLFEGIGKADATKFRQNIDAMRWPSKLNDPARLQRIIVGEPDGSKAGRVERVDQSTGILRIAIDPEVEILRVPGVTVEGDTEYIRNCFEEYNAHTDPSGRYFTLYKRWHLIGLEVGVSVASVATRGEPTGVAIGWNADVVATAKRDLRPGELLDGEGGYTVWGKLLPAATSRRIGGLPLGLAHDLALVRPVAKGEPLSWDDVAVGAGSQAYRLRREMESVFGR